MIGDCRPAQSSAAVADALFEAHEYTLAADAHLTEEQQRFPQWPVVNLPRWEYSQPWFGGHAVLRGGSWATRSRLVQAAFRNFHLPHRHDPFVGFCSCAMQD
jgi:EgtB-related family protein